jgi:hypothetical protein
MSDNDKTMIVQVTCVTPEVQHVILSVPNDATFRDIRKKVNSILKDEYVLVFNGVIAENDIKLIDAEFQKYPPIIAMNAMVHAKSLELHLNMTQ